VAGNQRFQYIQILGAQIVEAQSWFTFDIINSNDRCRGIYAQMMTFAHTGNQNSKTILHFSFGDKTFDPYAAKAPVATFVLAAVCVLI
jgi:hypothetical protein